MSSSLNWGSNPSDRTGWCWRVFRGPPCWTGTKEGRNKKVEERSLPGESSGRGVLWGGAPSLVRDTTCCSSASARLAHSDAAAPLTPPRPPPHHTGACRGSLSCRASSPPAGPPTPPPRSTSPPQSVPLSPDLRSRSGVTASCPPASPQRGAPGVSEEGKEADTYLTSCPSRVVWL